MASRAKKRKATIKESGGEYRGVHIWSGKLVGFGGSSILVATAKKDLTVAAQKAKRIVDAMYEPGLELEMLQYEGEVDL